MCIRGPAGLRTSSYCEKIRLLGCTGAVSDWPACTRWAGDAGINRLESLAGLAEVQVIRPDTMLTVATDMAGVLHFAFLKGSASRHLSGVTHCKTYIHRVCARTCRHRNLLA